MKNIFIMMIITSFLFSTIVFANRVEMNQDYGAMRLWTQNKYLTTNGDLIVHSQIILSVSPLRQNYSNNYSFEFSIFEPNYRFNEIDIPFYVYVFKNCNNISIPLFINPFVECSTDSKLKENKDFVVVKSYNKFTGVTYYIVIFNENSSEWTDYDILLQYNLPKFDNNKGENYYLGTGQFCINLGEWKKCPVNGIYEYFVFADKDYHVYDYYPKDTEKQITLSGMEYFYIDNQKEHTIEFYKISEKEFLAPLIWQTIGIIGGFVFGLISGYFLWRIKHKMKMKERHFNRLKKDVIKLWLDNLYKPNSNYGIEVWVDKVNDKLFLDLKNHYKEAIDLWDGIKTEQEIYKNRYDSFEIKIKERLKELAGIKTTRWFTKLVFYEILKKTSTIEKPYVMGNELMWNGCHCAEGNKSDLARLVSFINKLSKSRVLIKESNELKKMEESIEAKVKKLEDYLKDILISEKLSGNCKYF